VDKLLALDFGGTKLTAGVIAVPDHRQQRDWHAYRRVFLPPDDHAHYEIRTMFSLAKELLDNQDPIAMGVSFGGPVDYLSGTVRLSHHVPGWENLPLCEMLEAEFHAPAQVDNDANVAAIGEHRYGAGKGYASLMYITISTGVGGGWILDGKPWRGVESMAGEIGHTVVDPKGPRCLCGKKGCLERLASGRYMAQDAQIILKEQPDEGGILRQLVGGHLDAISGEILSQAASQGEPLAWKILQRSAWALGTAIGNAANLINPQLFVLGGGVTKAGVRYWDVIRTTAEETSLPEVHFEILPAALGDDAPLWGAVALAEDLLERKSDKT